MHEATHHESQQRLSMILSFLYTLNRPILASPKRGFDARSFCIACVSSWGLASLFWRSRLGGIVRLGGTVRLGPSRRKFPGSLCGSVDLKSDLWVIFKTLVEIFKSTCQTSCMCARAALQMARCLFRAAQTLGKASHSPTSSWLLSLQCESKQLHAKLLSDLSIAWPRRNFSVD